MALRVLIVDDSSLFQQVIREALKSIPEIQVVGVAGNGRMAITGIQSLKPDLITLDIEMPELDGIGVLKEIREKKLEVGAIMVSSLTRHGGVLTLQALELGAFHFVQKPSTQGLQESIEAIRGALVPLIQAFARSKAVRDSIRNATANLAAQTRSPQVVSQAAGPDSGSGPVGTAPPTTLKKAAVKPELVLIGASTGGPEALGRLLPGLPAGFEVPILIVQHMPPLFTQCLAESLASKCALKVREAADGDMLEAGTIYIAPGGKQMKVFLVTGDKKMIRITDDAPEKSCKPSVDYLFRSVALQCPGKAMAVILTGMGNDGTLGLQLLKRDGSVTIAQDEASCVVFGMPREAIQAGVIDHTLPLDGIAQAIVRVVRGMGV